MKCIAYNGGYKYQLKKNYSIVIDIKPTAAIKTEYIEFSTKGKLNISKGYAWDGPSGPLIDTLTIMRGSLVHDALYQLMRDGYLDNHRYRDPADRILQKICKVDGMWSLRAWWIYQGVRLFGDPAADPASKRPVTRAPRGCNKET